MAHMGGVVCGGGRSLLRMLRPATGDRRGKRRRETVRHLPASLLTQHSLSSSLCRDSIATIFVALIMKPHTLGLACAPQQ